MPSEPSRPICGPSRSAPDREPVGSQASQVLEEQTQCDFHERPLAAAIRYFAERHRIEISIDDDCVSDSGTELTTPVTLKTNGILLRSALRSMLEPLGLAAVVRDGKLLVTALEETDSIHAIVIYPVGDLPARPLWHFSGYNFGNLPFDQAMHSAIGSNCRVRNGLSFGFVNAPTAQALVTAQTEEGQEKTAALLASLRRARDAQRKPSSSFEPIEVVAAPQQAARQKIRQVLAKPLPLQIDRRPLDVAIEELARRLAIEYPARPPSVHGAIAASLPITLGGSKATLDEALHRSLDPSGLTYVLVDESLLITSPERAEGCRHLGLSGRRSGVRRPTGGRCLQRAGRVSHDPGNADDPRRPFRPAARRRADPGGGRAGGLAARGGSEKDRQASGRDAAPGRSQAIKALNTVMADLKIKPRNRTKRGELCRAS